MIHIVSGQLLLKYTLEYESRSLNFLSYLIWTGMKLMGFERLILTFAIRRKERPLNDSSISIHLVLSELC